MSDKSVNGISFPLSIHFFSILDHLKSKIKAIFSERKIFILLKKMNSKIDENRKKLAERKPLGWLVTNKLFPNLNEYLSPPRILAFNDKLRQVNRHNYFQHECVSPLIYKYKYKFQINMRIRLSIITIK